MKNKKQPSELALQTVAQAWCKPTTSSKVMDSELSFAFAEILDEILSQPWLGNATTRELLEEIAARNVEASCYVDELMKIMDLDYRTVD